MSGIRQIYPVSPEVLSSSSARILHSTSLGTLRIVIDPVQALLEEVAFVDESVPERVDGSLAARLEGFGLPPAPGRFAVDVRAALASVPPGRTITYAALAERAGHPGAARAVGRVMSRNMLALLVPCHRVVPSKGGWGTYRWGSARKEALIHLEMETGLSAWKVL